MPATGAIFGRVMTPEGKPVAGAAVMITGSSPPHPDIAALTNERGEFRLTDLLPGDYTVLVNAEDQGPQTGQALVEPDRVTQLDLSMTG